MTDQLKACPFCGGQANVIEAEDVDGRFAAVGCSKCGCGSRQHYFLGDDARQQVTAAWNSRPQAEDGKAVAWQYREAGKPWRTVSKPTFEKYRDGSGYEWRELFIHPPRAQSAGEAVAWMDPDGTRVIPAKTKNNASSAYSTATSGYTIPLYTYPPRVQSAEEDANPLDGKYGDVLTPFVAMMERELHANAGKGDRPGWLRMTPAVGMLEIYYHAAKLQKAVKDGNAAGIREYGADVANMAMMLVDVCGALEVPHSAALPNSPTFQDAVATWMDQCFVPSLYSNMTERGDRLLEEVLELLQAHGYDPTRVATLVDYVYGRLAGEPAQEVGGVMVTLAGFCWVAGLDMHAAGAAELARITQPEVMAKIRAKQEAKNALHFDTLLLGYSALSAQHGEAQDG